MQVVGKLYLRFWPNSILLLISHSLRVSFVWTTFFIFLENIWFQPQVLLVWGWLPLVMQMCFYVVLKLFKDIIWIIFFAQWLLQCSSVLNNSLGFHSQHIQDIALVASCTTPSEGNSEISARLLTHFCTFVLPATSLQSLQRIFQVIYKINQELLNSLFWKWSSYYKAVKYM